jgi:hypothetical protein
MTLAGFSQAEIRRWIGQVRASGMDSRFTLKPSYASILCWYTDTANLSRLLI